MHYKVSFAAFDFEEAARSADTESTKSVTEGGGGGRYTSVPLPESVTKPKSAASAAAAVLAAGRGKSPFFPQKIKMRKKKKGKSLQQTIKKKTRARGQHLHDFCDVIPLARGVAWQEFSVSVSWQKRPRLLTRDAACFLDI